MIVFYTSDINGNIAQLHDDEAAHCTKTLRKNVGDAVQWVDGRGGFYEGKVLEVGKKSCTLGVVLVQHGFGKSHANIHIAVAPTKNIDRWEWFVEKAVEIGVSSIIPIYCDRSERVHLRLERTEKVAIAAMKQSLKAYLPTLEAPVSFQALVKKWSDLPVSRFIAHCEKGDAEKTHLFAAYAAGTDAVLLIGPEGDFSPAEIACARAAGFREVSLGASRLRTETAAVVGCTIFQVANEVLNLG